MSEAKKVLFLCTGNSCRSQMAEAFVNACLGYQWRAFSAGTKPSNEVHPLALQVLSEAGIEHSGTPTQATTLADEQFDLVITVCDDAAQSCPTWLGNGIRIHRGFYDPAEAEGTLEERLTIFRRVRDEIFEKIPIALDDFLQGKLDESGNPLSDFSSLH